MPSNPAHLDFAGTSNENLFRHSICKYKVPAPQLRSGVRGWPNEKCIKRLVPLSPNLLCLNIMQRILLTLSIWWACFISCIFCMPAEAPQLRNLKIFEKYNWPEEALRLMMEAVPIPKETYTDTQANNFVKNGFAYLEQTSDENHMFNALGSDQGPISVATVYGLENAKGEPINTRWRWLPLVEGFEAKEAGRAQPIYHTSRWANGMALRSMDVLRVDFYYWQNVRFFVPTAIVRPVQRKKVFGQGLQFTTVYEFPTSFAHYLRDPTLVSANRFLTAIRQEAHKWLALLSDSKQGLLYSHYNDLTLPMTYYGLSTAFSKSGKRIAAGILRSKLVSEGIDAHNAQLQIPMLTHQQFAVPQSHAGVHQSLQPGFQASSRYPDLSINRGANVNFGSNTQDSAWVLGYQHLQEGASSSAKPPSTELRLGREETPTYIYAPTAQRVEPARNFAGDPWLRSHLHAPSSGIGVSTPVIFTGAGPSGFSPWRKTDHLTSGQHEEA